MTQDQNNSDPAGEPSIDPKDTAASEAQPEPASPADVSAQASLDSGGPAELQSEQSSAANNTVERGKHQEKAAPSTFPERLSRRFKQVDDLMVEKESLQLKYVFESVPKPYYERWKQEANEMFTLLVNLKHRRPKHKKTA